VSPGSRRPVPSRASSQIRLTTRLTEGFAIRAFLNADLDRTLRVVQTWVEADDDRVRRLASEGTRPRLPWAKRVPALFARPEVTLPTLDALHRDSSEFDRRSVGNHLWVGPGFAGRRASAAHAMRGGRPGGRVRLLRDQHGRRHSLVPLTTRRYYPGGHALELQVNGIRHGHAAFDLSAVIR
jgi:hypothetical protein